MWHFSETNRQLRYCDNREIVAGRTLKVEGPVELCEHGLHASKRLIDAIKYAPGPYAARSAAESAAESAARSAARSAAESAAESAARSAARSAAESAYDVWLEKMILAGRPVQKTDGVNS